MNKTFSDPRRQAHFEEIQSNRESPVHHGPPRANPRALENKDDDEKEKRPARRPSQLAKLTFSPSDLKIPKELLRRALATEQEMQRLHALMNQQSHQKAAEEYEKKYRATIDDPQQLTEERLQDLEKSKSESLAVARQRRLAINAALGKLEREECIPVCEKILAHCLPTVRRECEALLKSFADLSARIGLPFESDSEPALALRWFCWDLEDLIDSLKSPTCTGNTPRGYLLRLFDLQEFAKAL